MSCAIYSKSTLITACGKLLVTRTVLSHFLSVQFSSVSDLHAICSIITHCYNLFSISALFPLLLDIKVKEELIAFFKVNYTESVFSPLIIGLISF